VDLERSEDRLCHVVSQRETPEGKETRAFTSEWLEYGGGQGAFKPVKYGLKTTLYEVALDGFTFMNIYRWRAECTDHIGTILERRGDIAKAAKFWREAKPLFTTSLQTMNSARMEAKLLVPPQQK
jgi:hypothetical protein